MSHFKQDSGWGASASVLEATEKVFASLESAGFGVELHTPNLPSHAPDGEAKRLKKKAKEENPEYEWRGDSFIVLKDSNAILDVCRHLRDELGWEQLIDCTAMDPSAEATELWGCYQFLSISLAARLSIEIHISKENATVPSVTSIYPTADWHERESAEMFGIAYEGHPDPRNILLPDDWEGFPLRKDYEFPEEYHGVPCN